MQDTQIQEGELPDTYAAAEQIAVVWKQERDALRDEVRALFATFVTANEQYNDLLAEWQVALAECAARGMTTSVRADALAMQVVAQGEKITKAMIATRRSVAERSRFLRGGYSPNRGQLRVLRQQREAASNASALPAPASLVADPEDRDEVGHFFHDMRNNLQTAILATAGLERDLPLLRRAQYLHTLRRALTNLTEDTNVLDPVENHPPLPARPILTLVPPPANHSEG